MRYLNEYLNEVGDRPTRIVKVIGDVCAILVYTAIVGLLLYAVLR
jgi:hypothetical protein